jgi:lipopolysaccharide export system permease protein
MFMRMFLQRYLTRQLLFSTIVIAFALTMIIWLTQSLRLLDLVINGGAPLHLFGYMLLLTIPRFFELILPLALAVSIVFLFNKLIMDSELVVMQACGLSPWQLARAVIVLAFIIGTVLFLLGGWLTPKANQELDRVRSIAKSNFSLNLLRAGVFNTMGDNITIYLSERRGLDDLRGLLIHFSPKDKPSQTIWAKRGGMVIEDGKPIVIVHDGMRQEYNPETHKVESLLFASYQVDLTNLVKKKDDNNHSIEANEYNLPQLFTEAPKQAEQQHQRQFTAEAHIRLSRPFLVFSFALCAAVPFLRGHYNRRGQAWRILTVVMLLIGLQAAYLGASALAQRYAAGDLLLYIVAIVPAGLAICYLQRAQSSAQWRNVMQHLKGQAA